MNEGESTTHTIKDESQATIQTTERHGEGARSLDSTFNYAIQGNWSMIFTDDNSTDLDIHSNSSYDSDTQHDVVSESDSNHAYSSGSVEEPTPSVELDQSGNHGFSQGNSITTIKPAKEENAFKLPDPLGSSDHPTSAQTSDNNEKQRPELDYNWSKITHLVLYFLAALIVIDKGLQLTNISPFSDIGKQSVGSFKLPPVEPNSWTFVQYVSKDGNNKEVISKMSIFTGEPSSWDLLKALVNNVALTTNEHTQRVASGYKEVLDQSVKASKHISEQISEIEWSSYWKASTDRAKGVLDTIKSNNVWKKGSNGIKSLSSNTLDRGSASYHYLCQLPKNPKVQEYQKTTLNFLKESNQKLSSTLKEYYDFISDRIDTQKPEKSKSFSLW